MQFHVIRHSSVTSTMDVARHLAEAGAPEGTTVVADEQTAGRGRVNHTWYSPPGQSLYLSVVLRPAPALAPDQMGWITMAAALAVRDGILEIRDWRSDHSSISNLQSPISIKWFNDVLLSGRKVCGILLEGSFTGDRLDYCVLGIGLNVNTRFDDAPEDVRARATSLANEYANEVNELKRINEWNELVVFDREDILQQVLARFGERYDALLRTRQSPAGEYAQYVETLGREVRIDVGGEGEIVAGRALRIDPDGALIVQTPSGEQRVGAGEVM
jgi:BirA family biotin operon repressor/biotin-[acetyl-CoA-carboxylase] ligase